jgi:hypothetical protein
MYPYLYDPDFSRGTLPPDSPEQGRHATPLRRSLVSRSHSRGRKVSFRLDGEESDIEEISFEAYRSTSNRRSVAADYTLSKAVSESEDHEEPRRRRGQTPGPGGNPGREKHT